MFEREKLGKQQQWKSSLNKWWHNINTHTKTHSLQHFRAHRN